MAHIDSLYIKHFRGVTQELTLDFPKKRISILFGENGTGKTSIVDAIDLATNRNPGSIKDKRGGNTANLPSLDATAPTEIRLKSLNRNCRVTIGKGAPKFDSDGGMETRILRRSNVQRFIEASASDKFAEIKHLLGLEAMEDAESSIRDAIKRCHQELVSAKRSYADTKSIVTEAWEDAGRPGNDEFDWASTSSSDLTDRENEDANRLLKDLHGLQKEIGDLASTRGSLSKASAEVRNAHEAICALPSIGHLDAIALGRVLAEVEHVLTVDTNLDSCPVCEQPIVHAHLVEELRQRRDSLRQHTLADENARAWDQKYKQLTETAASQAHRVIALLRHVQSAGSKTEPISHDAEPLTDLELLQTNVNAEIERVQKDMFQNAGQRQVQHALMTMQNASSEVDRLNQQVEMLTNIETRMREHRHAFSQSVLDSVRDECNRMYDQIHPDEKLGFSSISVDPTQRASLIQKGSFADRDDVSPQALYSEGHLDTLGFAFWLAHCKIESKSKPGKSVIVIDDVFSSVDSEHLGRIVSLLFNESRHFAQVILATHSRSVVEAFIGPRGDANRVHILELNSFWTPECGARLNSVPALVVNLRASMTADVFDRQKIASTAGIALERAALKLLGTFRVQMPYQPDGAYELSVLMDRIKSIASSLKFERSVELNTRPLNDIVSDIQKMKLIRNQVGAHFSASGLEISDKEVHRFGLAAIEFIDAITCEGCGSVPDFRMPGDRFRCRCPKDRQLLLWRA